MGRKASNAAANHLRAWRTHRGLTQEELAEKVGTTGNVISLLESGARGLSDHWLYRLGPALGTRPGFLLEFAPNDPDLSILEVVVALGPDGRRVALRILSAFKAD